MANTEQDDAVGGAIELIAIADNLRSLRGAIKEFTERYNNGGWNAKWGAMATAAQNTDGSLGAADGSPVATNPITVGNINRPKDDLVSGVTMILKLDDFLNNIAATQGDYNTTIDKLVS